jgi:acyl-CoA synthetase (AMP-forming)/AMP-acid ligase II
MRNIVSILVDNAERFENKPALIRGNDIVTYGQLLMRVQAASVMLRSRGIQRGDRLLVFIPMSIELYVTLLAILYRGAAAVFLDAWSHRSRLEQALRIIPCKGFAGTPQAHFLRLLSEEIRKIPVKIWSGFGRMPRDGASAGPPQQVSENETALVTFTTGSTGIPKAANRTHGFLLAQHEVLKEHLGQTENDIDLITLPVFVLNSLAAGATALIPPGNPAKPEAIHPGRIVRAMTKRHVGTAIASPVFFEKIAGYLCAHRGGTGLRRIFLGGAPVYAPLAKRLCSVFPETDIEIVYGSTEAEPISFVNARELTGRTPAHRLPGLLAGKPCRATAVRILKILDGPITCSSEADFDSMTLSQGKIGEICVSGKHVLKEYLNCPEAQAENKIRTGETVWHRTGDAGYVDANGDLYLMGRTKSRFTWHEKEFFPFGAEQALLEIDAIACGTVMALDNQVVCVIEVRTGMNVRDAQVLSCCGNAGYECVESIRRMTIPRDPRHHSKIDYGELKRRIGRGKA